MSTKVCETGKSPLRALDVLRIRVQSERVAVCGGVRCGARCGRVGAQGALRQCHGKGRVGGQIESGISLPPVSVQLLAESVWQRLQGLCGGADLITAMFTGAVVLER